MTVQRLNAGQPIVGQAGQMEQPFRAWAQVVSDQLPITGSGTPEGAIEAPQFSLYLDTAAGAGSIQYRKMQPEIGGDRTKGWLLV